MIDFLAIKLKAYESSMNSKVSNSAYLPQCKVQHHNVFLYVGNSKSHPDDDNALVLVGTFITILKLMTGFILQPDKYGG